MMTRKLLLFCSVSICVAAFLSTTPGHPGSDGDERITVLNPAVTEKPVPRIPLAPRLNSLAGKTIYLVDMNYEGMGRTPVLEEMQRWFARNVPTAKIVFKLKSGSYVADDPALWKEIASNKGSGVILGVAG